MARVATDGGSTSTQQAYFLGQKANAHHLRRGRLNFSVLRDAARHALSEALASVGNVLSSSNSNILLVWDAALMKPFGLIAEYSFLKENGVGSMVKLESTTTLTSFSGMQTVAVIVRAEVRCMPLVAAFVRREKQLKPEREFYLIMVPAQCSICRDVLKAEQNALGCFVKVLDCPVDLYPIEYDVLSLELHTSFKDCFVANYPAPVHRLAQALAALQGVYGTIPFVYGKGMWAKRLLQVLETMRQAYAPQEVNKTARRIDNLLVFDRTVDLLSVLPMQSTYEGLIDEFFGINCTAAKFTAPRSAESPTSSNSGGDAKILILNSADEVYADIRDKSFNAAGGIISKRTRDLIAQEAEIKASRTVTEMKKNVPRIAHITEAKATLSHHIMIAELVKRQLEAPDVLQIRSLQLTMLLDAAGSDSAAADEHLTSSIERFITEKYDFNTVVRLIAMQAQCRTGGVLKEQAWQNYKKLLLRSYGFENVLTIENLEEAGFFGTMRTKPWLAYANQALRLISPLGAASVTAGGPEGGSAGTPNDISYVFNGAYAPITARIAQRLAKPGGWNSMQDALDALPGGERCEKSQSLFRSTAKHGMPSSASNSSLMSNNAMMFDEPRTTLVVFIGGVTYAEIAALRFLSHQEDLNMEYIVLTTHIINGSKLIDSLSDKLEPRMF